MLQKPVGASAETPVVELVSDIVEVLADTAEVSADIVALDRIVAAHTPAVDKPAAHTVAHKLAALAPSQHSLFATLVSLQYI